MPKNNLIVTFTLYKSEHFEQERKTFIIFGMPRGGTTMVAGVAKLCGLDIGKNLPINLEDDCFNINVIKQKGLEPLVEIKKSLVARNTNSNPVWGWKFPRAISYLDNIRDHIINPYLIVVMRDPIATAGHLAHNHGSIKDNLETVLAVQRNNFNLINRWKVPSLAVSYERSISNPALFIEDLCTFIGVSSSRNKNEIIQFMEPGTYKMIE